MGVNSPAGSTHELSGALRRMAFSLIPKEMKFFDMFDEAAAIITRASEIFLDMLTNFDRGPNPGEGFQAPAGLSAQPVPIAKANPSDRVAQRCDKLREEEHACD